MSNDRQSLPARWKHAIWGRLEKVYGYIVKPGSEETVGMAPVIHQFSSSSRVADGRDITLSWNVENTTRLLLNDLDVTGQNSCTVNPRVDTTYILHAFNDLDNEHGESSAPIAIQLDRTPPYIHFFRSSATTAHNGEPVSLSWQVAGAAVLEIEGIGRVTGESHWVTPHADTIYVLRATSHAGLTTTAHAGIEVDKTPPVIVRLEVEPKVLTDNRPVRVTWETARAQYVEITGFGQFPASGTAELPVRSDMALQFRAVSPYRIPCSEEIEITTSKTPPVIHGFYTDRAVLTDGSPAILNWEVEGADHIEIDQGIGEVTRLHSCPVHTLEDRLYTLTARSYFGVIAQTSLMLKIDRTPPEITLFQSDKSFILTDRNVELRWQVAGAHKVVLHPLGNTVDNQGSASVLVAKDTIFRLVAYNFFGYSSQADLTVRILPIPVIESLLVPSLSIEQTVEIAYDHLVPSALPEFSVPLNINLLSVPLPMFTLQNEAFTPPLELREHTWMEQFTTGFLNQFQTIVTDLRQLIHRKMQEAE